MKKAEKEKNKQKKKLLQKKLKLKKQMIAFNKKRLAEIQQILIPVEFRELMHPSKS
jgi:ribosomal protein S4